MSKELIYALIDKIERACREIGHPIFGTCSCKKLVTKLWASTGGKVEYV